MSEVFEKVDLPSGGWVEFRDPKGLTRGQLKPLIRARQRIGMSANLIGVLSGDGSAGDLADSEVDLLGSVVEACALVLIVSWSFDFKDAEGAEKPLKEALDDLDPDDYDAIVEAASKHRTVLIPDFDPTPEKTDVEGRENPTGPSPESKPPSEASRTTGSSPKTN